MTVGSKNFSEQIILGEMLAQQIERTTDLEVDRRLNLGGTFICDVALRAGQIDLYVEYTGTAFTAILKQEPVHDHEAVYRYVREAYLEQGLEWLSPLGFNNTFAILVRQEDARRLGLETISDVARHSPSWQAGFGYEFIEREDGFKGLTQTYGLRFAAPPRVMELGLIYRALAEKEVDLIAGDSTSGLIHALNLVVLKDDRNYFPPYDSAPVVRVDTLEKHPELRTAIEHLAGMITEEKMRELNYAVDGQHQPLKKIVMQFLEENIP